MSVSVALPVRDGAATLREVLATVRAQRLDAPVELVVIDSGSRDDSVAIARSFGAVVEEIAPAAFSHGGTRNALMELAGGTHVAFLTQDSVPADERWLARLLDGFGRAERVGLVCGPYRARPGHGVSVERELAAWFHSFGGERVDRSPGAGPGPASFFSTANGCVARTAWEQVPFRVVPYAEDQRMAVDMLRAGWAKVFLPDAAVVHSHAYPPLAGLRRTFDEFRALLEVYGHRAEAHPARVAGRIRHEVGRDRAWARQAGVDGAALERTTLAAVRYHTLRAVGAGLGTRADRLPSHVRGLLSLERRATYEPSHEPVTALPPRRRP